MSERPARATGVAAIVVTMLVGTSAMGEVPAAPAAAGQPEIVHDWQLFNIADTNGDGLGDLFWFSPSAGVLEVWLMNGAHVLAPGPPIPGPPGDGWKPVTAVDFNGDGLSDLVWTNPDHGTMAVWLMNGAQLLAPGPVLAGPPGEGWAVTAAGDTNGDGLADVVWHDDETDAITVWLMNGAQALARGPEIPGPTDPGHVLDDLADINGDGLSDIVWSHPGNNTLEAWLMNGAELLARRSDIPGPPGGNWTDVAVTDVNGDVLADVVSTNAERGSMIVSLLNGAHLLARGPEISGPGEGWTLVFAGDTNGDALVDAAWQKEGTSLFAIWLMNGVRVLAPGPISSGPGEIAAEP